MSAAASGINFGKTDKLCLCFFLWPFLIIGKTLTSEETSQRHQTNLTKICFLFPPMLREEAIILALKTDLPTLYKTLSIKFYPVQAV